MPVIAFTFFFFGQRLYSITNDMNVSDVSDKGYAVGLNNDRTDVTVIQTSLYLSQMTNTLFADLLNQTLNQTPLACSGRCGILDFSIKAT